MAKKRRSGKKRRAGTHPNSIKAYRKHLEKSYERLHKVMKKHAPHVIDRVHSR